MQKMKKILSLVLVLIMCFSVVPMTDLGIEASAATQTSVKITTDGQVVDTYMGVQAKYILGNSDTGDYCCAAYVKKFYNAVYGVDVWNLTTGKTPSAGSGSFSVTSSPEPGDIGYQTNSRGSGHWFIIKEVNGNGTYTIIEQNWKWTSGGSTYCSINRNVSYSSTSGFKIFRWSGKPNSGGSSTPTDPNAIQYHDHSIEDISTKDARIKMWISNPSGKTIWSTGFFFGTDPDNLNLYVVNTKINWTDFCADYTISNYCGELSPGVKYYYRFYVVEEENFNYSQSDLYSFTTYGTSNVRYDHIETTAVSSLDANISAWAWNDVGYTISSYGFCLGESPTTMKKYQVYSNIAWTNFHTQVDVANYTGVLTPGKTYYYRFYAVIDTNYYSDVYSFTTDSTLPTFTVTFNANGGSCSTTSKTVTYSNTYGTLPTPTQSGYTFNGWYTSASGGSKITSDTVMKEIGNHTLYAHWTCNHTSTEVRNAKSATCTATGYTGDTYCKTCGTKLKTGTTISKTSHNSNTTIPAVAVTCTKSGLTEGKKCSVCGTVTLAQQTIAAKGHTDGNGDYKCDYNCGYEYEKPAEPEVPSDPSENCSCNCHKGGIASFFFRIINFFQKLFGMNKICECGAKH